ncbi:MAG: hypothetical protein NTY77_17340 [Elusimicrobia bacterium]|nr:hypothetical protein [Elusimicrobiota bacterium]
MLDNATVCGARYVRAALANPTLALRMCARPQRRMLCVFFPQ